MVLIPHFRLHHHIKLPEGRRHQVFHISDVHLGGITFMEKPFNAMIEKIKKTRFCSVILHGDVIENNMHDSAGSPSYDQYLTPKDQLHNIKRSLKPIAGKIRGVAPGNHEDRSTKKGGIDITPEIAEYLEVPLLNSHSLHCFHIDDTKHTLLVTHGASGATTIGGKMTAVERLRMIYDADAYIYGHVHHLMSWPVPVHDIYGENDVWFGINGSFMDYLYSYAQKKGYRQGIPGYLSTMIGREGVEIVEHRINGESFYQKFIKEFGHDEFKNKTIKTVV